MYSDILYPTDGSDGAKDALENVRDLARTYDATAHVMFVADLEFARFGLSRDPKDVNTRGMVGDPKGGDAPMIGDRPEPGTLRAEVEEHGVELVRDAADRLHPVDTRTIVRGGDPHEVILDYADKEDIDIIVMGKNGRTGISRYLTGSLTEKVVRTSDVPVLTVRKEDLLSLPS